MDAEFLTSAEAAKELGVSPSTVKRWVDEGELQAERTAGGHRRLRRAVLLAFRLKLAGCDPETEGSATQLVDLLISDPAPQLIESQLLAMHAESGSAWALGERLIPAIYQLGERWQLGRITIAEEHLASERLSRALARLSEWIPFASDAPRVILTTAQGDDHTLGLSLVELCLREAGWRTLWTGRATPLGDIVKLVNQPNLRIRMVAVSASVASKDARALALEEKTLGAACSKAGAHLLIGGGGAWPDEPAYGLLCRDLKSVDHYARKLRSSGS